MVRLGRTLRTYAFNVARDVLQQSANENDRSSYLKGFFNRGNDDVC
ncbi:MAG: hypothetical protein FD147_1596 [Chloroflexi bacterium]|nr:MAG: hypothetical protein FD147_1596 [Chloroflexota bacterium]